jgi:phosphopantothenoylcysteine decarboxylase/phosphopantothenate--cysteine ligase
LKRTVDILGELGKNKNGVFLVGFAAETENLIENATAKLKAKGLDLIIANDVSKEGAGFDVDTNRVTILDKNGLVEETALLPKDAIASQILNTVESRLNL